MERSEGENDVKKESVLAHNVVMARRGPCVVPFVRSVNTKNGSDKTDIGRNGRTSEWQCQSAPLDGSKIDASSRIAVNTDPSVLSY